MFEECGTKNSMLVIGNTSITNSISRSKSDVVRQSCFTKSFCEKTFKGNHTTTWPLFKMVAIQKCKNMHNKFMYLATKSLNLYHEELRTKDDKDNNKRQFTACTHVGIKLNGTKYV